MLQQASRNPPFIPPLVKGGMGGFNRQSRVLRGTALPAVPKAARLLPPSFNGVAIDIFWPRHLSFSGSASCALT